MKNLSEYIKEAQSKNVAIGHFNISNIETLWAIFHSAQKLNLAVIIGLSEGERNFFGVKQAAAVVRSIREEYNYPIFLNADHSYSFEKVKEAVDAGYDAVIFDGAQLPLEENIKTTKMCVEYAKPKGVLVEGELGFIGTSSKILDEIPEGAIVTEELMTSPQEAKDFVGKTGVDLFAPAVGNIHGMLRNVHDPRLNIERIKKISEACGVPLVLHGGSGTVDEDFVEAIKAGISIVHINTEIRVAWKNGIKLSLQQYPEEVAPYKIAKGALAAVSGAVEVRLKLFNRL